MALPNMNAGQTASANSIRDGLLAAENSAKTTRQLLNDVVALLKIALGAELDANRQDTALDAFIAEGAAISLAGKANQLLGDIIQAHGAMSKALSLQFADAGGVIQGGGGGRKSI